MTDPARTQSRLLETNKYPDRRAPPSRLRDHPVSGSKAPSAAQRFLLAKRVNAFLDEKQSVADIDPKSAA
jgi:hypothetical protein